MRLVYLDRYSIGGYSFDLIDDIITYLEPSLTITNSLARRELHHVKRAFNPTVHMNDVEGAILVREADTTVLIINQLSALGNKIVSELKCDAENHCVVVTDLIGSEVDPATFDFTLSGMSLIDTLNEHIHDYTVYTLELECGKKYVYKGVNIIGLSTKYDRNSTKVPLVETDGTPYFRFLPCDRTGLKAIPGLGRDFLWTLTSRGIESRGQLAGFEPIDLMALPGVGHYRATKWISCARAMEEGRIYRIAKDDLASYHRVFVDIETDSLDPAIIWHIGVLDDATGEYHRFLEKDPDQKGNIIRRFAEYLRDNTGENTCLLAWYGSGFDYPHLANFITRYAPDLLGVWESIEKIDIMNWTRRNAATPCRNSKLDDTASRLGYKWQIRGIDGKEVGDLYTSYMYDRSVRIPWDDFCLYGMDDVLAMKFVYEKIRNAPLLFDLDEMKKLYAQGDFGPEPHYRQNYY